VLKYEIQEPKSSDANAPLIVLMHGRGASRFDLLPLGAHMPPSARIVFPEAPFSAMEWGYGPGSAWYQFLGRNRPDPTSFSESLDQLHELIEHFGSQCVVVGGFSQGGTLANAYALAYPHTIAGVLNFSGFLADHTRVVVDEGHVGQTEFFWGHGQQDGSIPFELAIEGRAQLQEAGARLVMHDYDIGHWIDPQELADAVDWLTRVLRY
jgi:phospholipase/carboxylesterase